MTTATKEQQNESLALTAQKRESRKNLDTMREAKNLPAVFYGTKTKSTPITLSLNAFVKAWRQAGESGIISLDVEGGDTLDVLIQDVAVDPVTDIPIHVDFYAIDKDKKVTVNVPLEFEGEAPIAKTGEGTVVKVMHELEIEALPKDLPHDIKVDISKLTELDSHIAVSDLPLPAGVEATAEPEETVVSVTAQVEVEEEETEEAPDFENIEVEQKGKKEDEGEEGEAESKEE